MGNRRIAALAAVAVTVLATGAGPASAEPNFQAPTVAAARASTLPALAVDGAGNAIAAYKEGIGLFVVTRPAGGSWGAPEQIADVRISDIAIFAAFDGAGNATVAWAQSSTDTGHVATRPAGAATFLPAQQIATGVNPGLGIDFDVSRSGAALMTWGRTSDRAVAVARRPLGAASFEPQESLGFGWDSARGAVGEDGTMSVTSHKQSEPAKVAVRPAGAGAWEAPVSLGDNVGPLALANSAVDHQGNVLAVWVHGETTDTRALKARFRPAGPGTAFAAAETLAEVPGTYPTGTEFFGPPQVAFDGSGNATLLWAQLRKGVGNGAPWRIFTATRPAGGAFGGPEPVSADGPDVEYARLAVAPDGTALAVWRGFDAPRSFAGDFRDQHEGPVLASARVGGVWRSPATLTPSRAYQPAVAIGANGAGAVGWIRTHGGDCRQLEVSAFAEGPATALDPPSVQCGPPTPPDTRPPTFALGGERLQRAHRSKRVLVTFACDEPCAGTVKSHLTWRRKGANTSKPIRLPNVKYTTEQTAGRLLRFKLRLSSSLAKKLAAVLSGGGSAVVVARTTARDAAGNAGPPRKKTVRLIR